jgi:superfamily II DNA helicase RecQ
VSGVLQSKKRVEEIVETGLFQCDGFDGDMNGGERGSRLEGFRTGKTWVAVATNALGMGMDIAEIEWMIQADGRGDMLDYGQESGGAGGDGRTRQAILARVYDDEVEWLVQGTWMVRGGREDGRCGDEHAMRQSSGVEGVYQCFGSV